MSFGRPGVLRLDRPDTRDLSVLMGKWRQKASAMTFQKDGTVAYELFRTQTQDKLLLPAKHGSYRNIGGRLEVSWEKSDVWSAEEDVCVFRVHGAQMEMLCRNDGAQQTWYR
jgi:hypothetical protein